METKVDLMSKSKFTDETLEDHLKKNGFKAAEKPEMSTTRQDSPSKRVASQHELEALVNKWKK